MRIEFPEVPVAADMVPVDVCGNRGDRLIGQPRGQGGNIAHTQARINQQGAFLPNQKIAVRFLPMAVFANGAGIRIKPFSRKPDFHRHPFPIIVAFSV